MVMVEPAYVWRHEVYKYNLKTRSSTRDQFHAHGHGP